MRIAAGILMIIAGFMSLSLTYPLVERFGETANSMVVPLSLLLLGLTAGGGSCAFKKKYYWWALVGAICSVFTGFLHVLFGELGFILLPTGILAIIFLIKSKDEFDSNRLKQGNSNN